MRVITRMLNDHSILENFPIAKVLPEILNNMGEEQAGAEFELGPTISLNDKNLSVSPSHASKAADESLSYIANAVSTAKADRVMHPIIEYLDKKKAWGTYATRVLNVLMTNSQFVCICSRSWRSLCFVEQHKIFIIVSCFILIWRELTVLLLILLIIIYFAPKLTRHVFNNATTTTKITNAII